MLKAFYDTFPLTVSNADGRGHLHAPLMVQCISQGHFDVASKRNRDLTANLDTTTVDGLQLLSHAAYFTDTTAKLGFNYCKSFPSADLH